MSWGGPPGYPPPPPAGYGSPPPPPPPGQYPQPYPPPPSAGPYASHPLPPSGPQPPPPHMNQQFYGGYPPPPGGPGPYPPQPQGSPFHPSGGPPYGGPPGYPPPSQGPYAPPHGSSPYPPQPSPYPPPPSGGPGPYGQPPHPSDANRDAEALRKAMQGFGTNEKELIRVVSNIPDPMYMSQVEAAFQGMYRRHLLDDIHKETSGYFRETLEAIVRGPLRQDAHILHEALDGAGTNEPLLNDVLLGRSNEEIHALKHEYHARYHRNLDKDVGEDLSFKTDRLFSMILAARREPETAPVYPAMLDQDIHALYKATEGRAGTDQLTVCQIFTSRSDGQLRAVAREYRRKYQHPLHAVIHREFSGHMRDALLRMLAVAEDKAKADADSLEAAMAGMGTKDRQLLNRLVRMHWDKHHLQQVKMAYQHFYRRDLTHRVSGETSRYYRDLLVAMCERA